jgi:hypothetical protein
MRLSIEWISLFVFVALGQLTIPLQTKRFGKQIDGLLGQGKSHGLLSICAADSVPSGLRGKWNSSVQTYSQREECRNVLNIERKVTILPSGVNKNSI